MSNQKILLKKITYPKIVPNTYLISSDGRYVINTITDHDLKFNLDPDGYYRVSLKTNDLKHINVSVHRLVAWEFCEGFDPNSTNVVDHIDGNKLNNNCTNLEWVTSRENTRRAITMGLRHDRGEGNATAKHTNEEIENYCKLLSSGKSIMSIIREEVGDPMAKAQDHRALYVLLHKLKHKQLWEEISSKYEYPDIPKTDIDVNPGCGTFIYDEPIIRRACELLNNDIRPVDVAKILMIEYPDKNFKKRNLSSMVERIRSGKHWVRISSEYPNIRENFSNYINDIDAFEVCKLYEDGYSLEKIFKKICKNSKDKNTVRMILSNYRYMKKIDHTTTIEMIVDSWRGTDK